MSLIRRIARFGWTPDLPDHRDLRLAHAVPTGTLPDHVDLRPGCPPVVDQGNLGSCTANAIAAALLFAGMRQNEAPVPLSRLFIYYNEREMEGTVPNDAGAQIRDGVKSVAEKGACLELAWPYAVERFTEKPDNVAYFDAAQRKAIQYLRVEQSEAQIEACLASGFPIIFGFTVHESFESADVARTGIVPMPRRRHDAVVGGHAVLMVGYDSVGKTFLVRNSWGDDWGRGGYCIMPYSYLLNPDLADDFWTVRQVA
jgi:C1A family cysteine protease